MKQKATVLDWRWWDFPLWTVYYFSLITWTIKQTLKFEMENMEFCKFYSGMKRKQAADEYCMFVDLQLVQGFWSGPNIEL